MPDEMPHDDLLSELLELADQLGVQVRRVNLGGGGGGLANLRGRQIMFVDLDAPSDVQLEKTAAGLSRFADKLDGIYIRPAVRALLGRE